jgi:L-malate glycosyltransferase
MRPVKRSPGEQIRLLKFMTLFAMGGTEKQVTQLSGLLDRSKFDLQMACLRREGELLEKLEHNGIQITEYPVRTFYGFNALKQQLRFSRALRSNRIQIVHSYNLYANVFSIPAAKLAGVPCVIASLRDTGVYMNETQRRVHKLACRYADQIIVNAEAIRNWLTEQGYDRERIAVIPNGVNIDRSKVSASSGSNIRHEFEIPGEAPVVTMLSRLNRQKGVEHFIDAAAHIKKRFPEARFFLVGGSALPENDKIRSDERYQRFLEDRVASLDLQDRLFFTGFRSDVTEILAESSVSALPSYSEGLSNTVLESMAAGVPVVVTDVGGNTELIDHDRHGLLVPPRDTMALADAICRILGNPDLAKRLSAEALKRVTNRYSFDKMVRKTEDLYVRLLEEKS